MRIHFKTLIFLGLLAGNVVKAEAANFVVHDIRVDGLQGISQETVLNYLPVKVGQVFSDGQSATTIRTLYETGFFSDVSLSQQGSTLVVKVVERPIIGSIGAVGNTSIPKDKLDDVLKQVGLIQGHVFDESILERVKQSLISEYDSLGKYSATVDTKVIQEPRNRVDVKIAISEGRTVQVKQITFIGNNAFSSRKLIEEMQLGQPHFWSFLSRADEYSQEKLDKSLDALRNYYLDRGYLKFKIDSSQATLTPDRKSIYIVIHMTEGPIYTVKGYQLAGNLILSQQRIQRVIHIKPGDVFSRKAVRDASNSIGRLLGDFGYAFATVNTIPDVDEKNKQISLTFYVDPGNRVYVRRINFNGNVKTEDRVLRRSARQMEGGLVSVSEVKETERQLNLTGYLENVHTETVPVDGTPDQVDLNYNVTEGSSAQATFGVGYGTDGFLVNAGLNQNNFLGTGKSLGLNFSNDQYSSSYNVSYNDPYYTPDGIQRGYNFYVQRTTPHNASLSRYTSDIYGANVNYSIPVSAHGDSLQLGYGLQRTVIQLGHAPSTQVQNFVDDNGHAFNELVLSSGWSRNGLDKAIFPTRGLYQAAGLQVDLPIGKSLDYYKASYGVKYYHPITSNGFILMTDGNLGYGNGFASTSGLPFFANYYAGGIGYDGAVRGYSSNTLGPKDSNGDSLGGNKLATGTLALIFPNPISADKLRTSVFMDAGNAYTSEAESIGGSQAGSMRYSTGLSVDWRVPVFNGILNLSLARALNAQHGDQPNFFQFNIGTSF